jgi:hypothetical protein
MLFNFHLRQLDNIQPWGNDTEKYLHWFGLTDGWYWLEVGNDELFRFTPELLALWDKEFGAKTESPYVDYHVVRLWEDILEILPHVLEPIPDEILRQIHPSKEAYSWRNKVVEHLQQDKEELSDVEYQTLDDAALWIGQRQLDTGYLQSSPRIWLWSDGTDIFIHWDNRDRLKDSWPVWTASFGTYSMPVAQFLKEVQKFDKALMNEMQSRIESIQKNWSRPEIQIDIDGLIKEQEDRSTWLGKALAKIKPAGDLAWSTVLDILEKVR